MRRNTDSRSGCAPPPLALERGSGVVLRSCQPRTASLALWPWVHVGVQYGLAAGDLFELLGLSEGQLRDPGVRVPQAAANRLIERVAQHVGLGAAMLVAHSLPQGHFNLLEVVMRSAQSVGHAVTIACRFFSLLHEGSRLQLERGPRHLRVCFLAGDEAPHPLFVEFLFGSFLCGARRETGVETLSAAAVQFRHRGARDRALHWETFGCTPQFQAVDDALEFDRVTADTPLLRASARLHAQAAAAAAHELLTDGINQK